MEVNLDKDEARVLELQLGPVSEDRDGHSPQNIPTTEFPLQLGPVSEDRDGAEWMPPDLHEQGKVMGKMLAREARSKSLRIGSGSPPMTADKDSSFKGGR